MLYILRYYNLYNIQGKLIGTNGCSHLDVGTIGRNIIIQSIKTQSVKFNN